MKMLILAFPEASASLKEKLGYDSHSEHDMTDGALLSLVESGFDIMVRQQVGDPGLRTKVGVRPAEDPSAPRSASPFPKKVFRENRHYGCPTTRNYRLQYLVGQP